MTPNLIVRIAALAVAAIIGSASTVAAQGLSIKFWPTFATFSSESLDFKTRTGLHGGLFFGGNRYGVLGV